jgi:hypothetical protein
MFLSNHASPKRQIKNGCLLGKKGCCRNNVAGIKVHVAGIRVDYSTTPSFGTTERTTF